MDNKRFVTEYLAALSGHAKTPDLVARYVADESLAEHIRQVEAAFPRYEIVANQTVADGDLVAVHGTFRGVHRGPFAGIDATGRTVSAPLMIFYRIANGRIAEHWLQFDAAALVAELRAPEPASTAATP